jgi:hypothetical protein
MLASALCNSCVPAAGGQVPQARVMCMSSRKIATERVRF